MLHKLLGLLSVSLLALLGTLPLTMHYFNQASVMGLFANLVLIPLIGFCVVPVGVLGVFAYPVSQALSALCMKACLGLLTPALFLIDVLASIEWTYFRTITPSPLEMAAYYLLLAALLGLRTPAGGPANPPPPSAALFKGVRFEGRWVPKPRFMKWGGAALSALILLADAAYWVNERFFNPDLKATVIDVGLGSAALLELPGGGVFVVDGGGFSERSLFDVGATVVAPVLWYRKIKTIDTIILSHPNSDHLNGLL